VQCPVLSTGPDCKEHIAIADEQKAKCAMGMHHPRFDGARRPPAPPGFSLGRQYSVAASTGTMGAVRLRRKH
jgi:hypothetical protein